MMKFVGIIAATATTYNTVHASLASLNKGQKEFIQAMGGNNRNLMLDSVKTLNQYGCWCFFDDEIVGNGKGTPRDFIDEECRDLHKAYTCAAAEIQGCEPWTVEMSHGTQSFNSPGVNGDIKRACEYANRFLPMLDNGVALSACAIAACTAETKFLQNVNTFLLSGDADYDAYTHSGANKKDGGIGTFNYEKECVAECLQQGNCIQDKDPRQCCGEYPDRFPFKVHAGDAVNEKACCGPNWVNFNNNNAYVDLNGDPISGSEVYSTATHQCVNDAVVAK